MALVDCKNCGGKISDKAEICPHCGFDLTVIEEVKEEKIVCEDCGAELEPGMKFCAVCGCPVSEEKEEKIVCEDCGAELEPEAKFCAVCGCPVSEKEETKGEEVKPAEESPEAANQSNASGDSKKSKIKIFAIIAAVILAFGIIIGASGNSLSGDDKVAYELIMDVAYNFKDPSSVRLVSGCVGVDKDCLFCGISATNGFGARRTEYYFIMGGSIIEADDANYLYKDTSELDIEKINKHLKKELGN